MKVTIKYTNNNISTSHNNFRTVLKSFDDLLTYRDLCFKICALSFKSEILLSKVAEGNDNGRGDNFRYGWI
jgi:hypothetical protein